MAEPQPSNTSYAQELSKFEIFDVLHSSAFKSDLDDSSFRKMARARFQSLRDAAERDSHLLSLTDIKRLTYCCSSLGKTLDQVQVAGGRSLWGLVQMTVMAAAAQAAIKSSSKDRLEDLATILSVLNSIDRKTEISDSFGESLDNLVIEIKMILLEDLESAGSEEFFALTNALFKCWPILLILGELDLKVLVDTVRRRVDAFLSQRVRHVTYCGTDHMMDDRSDQDMDRTERQQHQNFLKSKTADEYIGDLACETEEGLAIMQLREKIQHLRAEKHEMATHHAKVIERHDKDMDLMCTAYREKAEAQDALWLMLKKREAEQKDSRELLAEIEAEKVDLLRELAMVKAHVADLQLIPGTYRNR